MDIFFLALIFSISGAGTTVLLGDRNLLGGDLLSWNKFFSILFSWRFILAMLFALSARYSFMLINNNLLKNQDLAQNSTTITAFITSIGVIFIIIANAIFLGERINMQQGLGAILIMIGTWVVLK